MNDAKRLKKYLAVLGAFVFLGLGGCGQKKRRKQTAVRKQQRNKRKRLKRKMKSNSTIKTKKNGHSSQGKCNPRSTSKQAKLKR